MTNEQRSKAWYEGYNAYMSDVDYNQNPYCGDFIADETSKDWSDGYLEAQYEVEASFGEEDVA